MTIRPIRTEAEERRHLDEASKRQEAHLRRVRAAEDMPSLLQGQLSISTEKRVLWYRVPKVGSRSIYYHLKRHLEFECDHPYDFLIPVNLYRDYFKFGFVRNPWDRLVSCWSQKVARKNLFAWVDAETWSRLRDFPAFVDFVSELDLTHCDAHLRLQSRLIDLSQVDFVGRLEHFDRDYPEVCRRIGVPLDGLERINRSTRADLSTRGHTGHYREFYTDALADKVRDLYRLDIQIFGYRF